MKGIMAFLRGIGFKNVRPAVYAWFFNLLFTIFIYYGFYKVFAIPAGRSMIAQNGGETLGTATFLADILQHYRGSLPLVFSMASLYTLVFLVVSVYVSGGIYAIYVEQEKTSFTNLIASSTQNFFSMLKVFLTNLAVLVAALVVPLLLLVIFFSIKPLVANEGITRIFLWSWAGVTALFMLSFTAIYDFTRIFKLRDDKNILYSLKKAWSFATANKWHILLIFLLYGLSLVILYLFYLLIIGLVEHWLYVFLLFMVYQGFMMARYFLKIIIIRAEIRLLN